MRELNYAKLFTLVLTITLVCVGTSSKGFSQENFSSEQATVVEAIPATYPPIAMAANVSGTVVVRVKIKSNGKVESADVIKGQKLLHKPAKVAAAKWVFEESNEKTRFVDLNFIFEILPEGASSEELLPIFLPPYSVKIKEGLGRLDPL